MKIYQFLIKDHLYTLVHFGAVQGLNLIASLAEGHAWLKRRASLDVVTALQPMFRTTKSVCEMAHCDPLC